MLIFRYLTAEVLKSQLAVFLTLMTIFVSEKFVRILTEATDGSLPAKLIISMLALKLPQLASFILPLSLFLGIILAYSRVYADSEMTVLKACGVSEWYVVRVTLVSSVVMALFAAALTLVVAPWASEQEYRLEEKAKAESGLFSLRAGRFQQTGNEKAVVFVHDISQGGKELNKVFVAQFSDDNAAPEARIVYAEKGVVIEEENGEQQLNLSHGQHYETNGNQLDIKLTEFDGYQVEIQEQAIEHKRRKLEAVSSLALLNMDSSEAAAQFQWRLAIPLSILILTFIAVPLSEVNPRQGKFAKLVPAIVIYLAYFILLNGAKHAIEGGKIPTNIGLWWIHISALFIGVLLILRGRASGAMVKAIFKKREQVG